jgi:hypothetical protein
MVQAAGSTENLLGACIFNPASVNFRRAEVQRRHLVEVGDLLQPRFPEQTLHGQTLSLSESKKIQSGDAHCSPKIQNGDVRALFLHSDSRFAIMLV